MKDIKECVEYNLSIDLDDDRNGNPIEAAYNYVIMRLNMVYSSKKITESEFRSMTSLATQFLLIEKFKNKDQLYHYSRFLARYINHPTSLEIVEHVETVILHSLYQLIEGILDNPYEFLFPIFL